MPALCLASTVCLEEHQFSWPKATLGIILTFKIYTIFWIPVSLAVTWQSDFSISFCRALTPVSIRLIYSWKDQPYLIPSTSSESELTLSSVTIEMIKSLQLMLLWVVDVSSCISLKFWSHTVQTLYLNTIFKKSGLKRILSLSMFSNSKTYHMKKKHKSHSNQKRFL